MDMTYVVSLALSFLALSPANRTAAPFTPRQESQPEEASEQVQIDLVEYTREFAEALSFETGSVKLASGEATFELPEGWAFLQAKDAREVVENLWGNPPDTTTIGFIDPPHELGRLQSVFGIIVSLDRSGYIKDDDATDLDYGELLSDMQAGAREENEARVAAGYVTIDIVGWAEPPHYDQSAKKLYWAKELSFAGSSDTTLNYDVRVLGRKGALVLQAVSPMPAFDEVQQGMKVALAATSFNDGHRYADFDSSIDDVAAYGIGGLIAGKVAAKVGLFAVFLKFGKLIVVGAIGVFLACKRFIFGGKEEKRRSSYSIHDHPSDEDDPALDPAQSER